MSTMTEGYRYDLDDPRIYRNAMGRYKTQRQLAFIRAALPGRAVRILDVGGGGGRLAIPLAEDGHHVTVVDISAQALELLNRRTGDRVDLACSDLMSYAPSAPFHVALVVDTLKYMAGASPTDVFAKVGSWLSPGGLLVIAEINEGSWRNHLSERLGRRQGRPYNIATAEGYRRALTAAGFKILAERGFLWMPLPFNSDSLLVGAFARLEAALGLGRWIDQSPWLLIAARRPDAAPPA